MRPIGWGILVFIASGLVWVISSVGTFLESPKGFELVEYVRTGGPVVYVSGLIFVLSLPAAAGAEMIWRRRKNKRESALASPRKEKA